MGTNVGLVGSASVKRSQLWSSAKSLDMTLTLIVLLVATDMSGSEQRPSAEASVHQAGHKLSHQNPAMVVDAGLEPRSNAVEAADLYFCDYQISKFASFKTSSYPTTCPSPQHIHLFAPLIFPERYDATTNKVHVLQDFSISHDVSIPKAYPPFRTPHIPRET